MGLWRRLADWAVPETLFCTHPSRSDFVAHCDEIDGNGQTYVTVRCQRCGRTHRRQRLIGSDLARLGR